MHSLFHRVCSLTRASITVVAIAACAADHPVTAPVSPIVESQESAIVESSVASAVQDRSGLSPIDAILQRLVPSLDEHGIPLRNALRALQSRPADQAASDGLLRALEAIEAKLPPEYRPDLDAIRLELEVVALR